MGGGRIASGSRLNKNTGKHFYINKQSTLYTRFKHIGLLKNDHELFPVNLSQYLQMRLAQKFLR